MVASHILDTSREEWVGVCPPADLSHLPNEVLLEIVKTLATPDSGHNLDALKNLRMVDSTFNSYATPHVFDTVTIPPSSEDAILRMQRLSDAGFVKHISSLSIPIECIIPEAYSYDSSPSSDLVLNAKVWIDAFEGALRSFMGKLERPIRSLIAGQVRERNNRGIPVLSLEPGRSFFGMLGRAISTAPNLDVRCLHQRVNRTGVAEMLWQGGYIGGIEYLHIELVGAVLTRLSDRDINDEVTTAILETDTFITSALPVATSACYLALETKPGRAVLRIGTNFPETFAQNLRCLAIKDAMIIGGTLENLFENAHHLSAVCLLSVGLTGVTSVPSVEWKNTFRRLRLIGSLTSVAFSRLYYGDELMELGPARFSKSISRCRGALFSRNQEDFDALKELVSALMERKPSYASALGSYIKPENLRPYKISP